MAAKGQRMMPPLSDAAENLIITQEVSSQAEYDPRPEWPGGASGVTIGIGYDLGYVGPGQVAADWGAYLDGATVKRLQQVAGVKGSQAAGMARALRDASIPWDAAKAVFDGRTVPQVAAQTVAAFPGSDALPADCFGALVSLVYNRGPGMTDPPGHPGQRLEMRQIRDAIASGNANAVPDLIRSMKRLWSDNTGLPGRRDAEAALFESGLA